MLRVTRTKQWRKQINIFDTQSVRDDLKGRSVRGGIYTMSGEGSIVLMQVASVAILARILTPEHFGLIGMVTALTVIAERFKDLGLSVATVQKKEITHEQISTLFWINVIVGGGIMIILCSVAKPVAWFYADDRLIWVTVAISTSFLWSGLAVQHQAILRRQMQFGRIVGVNIGASFFAMTIAVILALRGYEYWALVWKEILRNVFLAIGTWMVCPWIPGLPVRNANISSMLRFGRDVAALNVVEYFTRSVDQILIGRFYGPSLLGLYRQAYQIMLLPISYLMYTVHSVAEPALSAVQHDPVRYKHYYKKMVTLLSLVSMPLMVFVCVHAEDIILLLLGESWMNAVGILQVLALGAFIKPAASTTGFVMITCGKTKRFFVLGVFGSVIYISGISIGIKWGAMGIAVAFVVATYIYFWPLVFTAFRGTPVSVELFLSAISPSVLSSVLMGAVLFIWSRGSASANNLYSIVASLAMGMFVYMLTWTMLPGGTVRWKEIWGDCGVIFRKGEIR